MNIEAFSIKSHCISGRSERLATVYTDRQVASAVAKAKEEEWTNYTVHAETVRVMSDKEGAIGRELVIIDRTTWDEHMREQALKKLTPAERRALKL